MGVFIDKLVSKLPNMAYHITNSEWRVTLRTVHRDLLWSKHVNTSAVIYSGAWCWHLGEFFRVLYFISPWVNSLVSALSGILPFIGVRKSFTQVIAVSLSFFNCNGSYWNILSIFWILIAAINLCPASQVVFVILWFVSCLFKII